MFSWQSWVVLVDLKGKLVQIQHGPAAVTGDESRFSHCSVPVEWEGAASRLIRESEDLPS